MSTSPPHELPHRALGKTLRRELDAARARVDEISARRREAQLRLQTIRAEEDAALASLGALEAVAREAGELVGDLDQPSGAGADLELLSGAALRDMIARIGLQQRAVGRAVHWRVWHGWLRDAGYDAAGKKPEATFQTQLARSALVRRTSRDGVYMLDLSRFVEEREELRCLHARLAQLPPPDQLALLGDGREQRRSLQAALARAERAIDEIWRVLAQERPPVWPDDAELVPEEAIAAWLDSGGDDAVR